MQALHVHQALIQRGAGPQRQHQGQHYRHRPLQDGGNRHRVLTDRQRSAVQVVEHIGPQAGDVQHEGQPYQQLEDFLEGQHGRAHLALARKDAAQQVEGEADHHQRAEDGQRHLQQVDVVPARQDRLGHRQQADDGDRADHAAEAFHAEAHYAMALVLVTEERPQHPRNAPTQQHRRRNGAKLPQQAGIVEVAEQVGQQVGERLWIHCVGHFMAEVDRLA